MAEIQKRTETVTKTFYRLDLDENEAQFLVDVLARIGGDLVRSRRRYAEAISGLFHSNRLYSTGGHDICKDKRSIYFNDTDS